MIEQTVLPLILASQSATRKRLLTKAGVPYEAADHEVDEVVLRARLKGDACSSEDAAHRLAEQKAKSVSTKFPDRLTLGADQLFVCEDHWLGKVSSVQEANDMLRRLSGKEHALITAISCVEN
ncbi:MAG: hypothetical protein HOK20_02940, partial [Alphaproteobacteria bacterium]|nr:hypothetical protein [Alphaproteobacteria bacterium]